MEIFPVNRSTISEISKELLNYIFAEFDRKSPVKNFTYRSEVVNPSQLQEDDISIKLTAEVQRNIYQSGNLSLR